MISALALLSSSLQSLLAQGNGPVFSATEKVTTISGKVVPKQLLSEQEQASPLAKYFYMPMAEVDPASIQIVRNGPIDPAKALLKENLNDLLNPGYLPSEIGYCTLPNGNGYVSSLVKMPGVTPEMIDWWFTWHQLEPLRYKIWDHYVHYNVSVSETDKQKLLSTTIPVAEKNWNVTHFINEDIGMGASNLTLKFTSPKDFGFDMTRFKEPNVGTAICTPTMVHFARSIPGGVELRTRFWFPFTPPGKMLEELNYHALEEYTNLAKILPSLYKEYGPKK